VAGVVYVRREGKRFRSGANALPKIDEHVATHEPLHEEAVVPKGKVQRPSMKVIERGKS
jgi:hypothetical protein